MLSDLQKTVIPIVMDVATFEMIDHCNPVPLSRTPSEGNQLFNYLNEAERNQNDRLFVEKVSTMMPAESDPLVRRSPASGNRSLSFDEIYRPIRTGRRASFSVSGSRAATNRPTETVRAHTSDLPLPVEPNKIFLARAHTALAPKRAKDA